MIIDLNGTQMEATEARIDPADRGLTLGDGVFETIRVRGGKPDRFEAHVARLRDGAKVLGIVMPTTDSGIETRLIDVVKANELSDAVVRITLSHGVGPRGLLPPDPAVPTLMITASSRPDIAGPVKAIIAMTTRRNEHSTTARIKSLSYLDNVIARREAAGYEVDDALLLNTQGRLAESTIANVFLMINGALLTPPVSDGALPGVMRADLIARFRAEEHPLEIDDLARAEEAFLTNALGIRPLIEVAGQPIGDGEPGLITQMLAARL
ncbi:MAG: 2-keto-4-methylthiobutyrate aminotransferase [Alphaproteobacteria bacterium]|nr:2-keto-4-methylthiobutyrate aminotransferase [Alphaproteobacteria bacterium]